ncbi:uncharacterized protein A4U43_C08F33830 [Asparagus officinalis]|uniref:heavy metal-associated isoprenylated plant protein 33-like n=1 Tax=Asparagus officinalis TaxID=4686 RepID=UPI00098E01FA|nr:heavy metal-associated isoprenylated plant protein 33-like [Asparagus officinalis]ONK61810.1 uncharacterized protein A4U43_C08F33830 [Asparagus officinalis]
MIIGELTLKGEESILSLFYIYVEATKRSEFIYHFLFQRLLLYIRPSMALVELKVGVHCDKCLKAIKKAIKKIEDIETYRVDTEISKVTVTGNVTTEEVVKVLQKIGKTATPWEECQVSARDA